MKLSHELIQLCNSLPQDIGLLSSDNVLVYTNASWLANLEKCASEHLHSDLNTAWPSLLLKDKQLYFSLLSAVDRTKSELGTTSDIETEFRLLDYQHQATFFIAPLELGDIRVTLVSIQITMNPLSSGNQPALLGRDETVLLNSLLEGVVIQDKNGVITANNPASESILGLSSNQMRGLDNADPKWGTITEEGIPCPPEDHPSSLAITKGVPILDFTMGVNKPDGSLSWLKINSQPIFEKNEVKPHMSVTSFVDITEERRRQKELTQISKRLQLALDAGEIGIWEYELSTERLVWDEMMFKIFDLKHESFEHKLSDFSNRVHPDDKHRVMAEFSLALTHNSNLESEFRILNSNNVVRHIYAAGSMIQSEKGEGNTFIGMNRDITDEKVVQEKIKESRNKLLNFVGDLPAGVCSITGNEITLNAQAEIITGYENSQLSDVDDFWDKLFIERRETSPELYESLTQTTDLVSRSTMQIVRRDGQLRWIEFRGCKIDDGQAWVMIDVTDQIEAEAELKHLAYFDLLTKLPNRTSIEDNLIKSIARAKRHSKKLGLLVLDIDSFKNINDTYGHPVGDQLLVLAAERLRSRLRESDFIGRIGGDEFMVIIEDVVDNESLLDLSTELLNCFKSPIELVDQLNVLLNISISIGTSVYPDNGEDYVTLFRNADTALYKAKSLGRNRVQAYLEKFTVALESKLSLEQRIESAIENNEFSIFYQPIVNCKTNRIESVESLARWFDDELGTISPEQFVSAAEASGQIIKLGKWVLRSACEAFIRWQKSGIELDYIAVNLSPLQFNDVSFIEEIRDTLRATGLQPNKLVLEITEGILVHNHSLTKDTLLKLKRLGIRLAIDDFGTGYSSLAYLKYFSVDILKIDRSFVKDIPQDTTDLQITSAVISMARNLNLKVVAEGVETQEQLCFMQEHSCDTYQGYLKSPAVSSSDFVALFNSDME